MAAPTKVWMMYQQLAFGAASGFGTHKKNNQHSCEQNFVVVPECACSEDEKGWMNHIRNIRILGRKEITLGANS
jgi:hypothetical protein